MPWFRTGPSPYETARAMIGAKAGDRVLVVGATDPGLAADTALVTGLNGSTVVVDPAPDMTARIDTAAGRAGALVETAVAPIAATAFPTDAFDIVVVQSGLAAHGEEERGRTLAEASRVARAGGRVVVVERTQKAGLMGAVMGGRGPSIAGADVCQLMTRAGLRGARVLAEIGGAMFVEAIKARTMSR